MAPSSLLSNRLSADPSHRVLLLEAGGRDNWIWFHIPVGYLFAIGNPRSDWCFKTQAETGLFNAGDNEGSSYFQVNQRRGRRWSAARGFLKPVLHRPNLRMETGCLVERVELDNWRATGIRYRQDGVTKTARAKGEVILAAGSIGSTQLLLLSGIGPGKQLLDHGLPVEL